jgi:hypothetical protein
MVPGPFHYFSLHYFVNGYLRVAVHLGNQSKEPFGKQNDHVQLEVNFHFVQIWWVGPRAVDE